MRIRKTTKSCRTRNLIKPVVDVTRMKPSVYINNVPSERQSVLVDIAFETVCHFLDFTKALEKALNLVGKCGTEPRDICIRIDNSACSKRGTKTIFIFHSFKKPGGEVTGQANTTVSQDLCLTLLLLF